MKINSYSSRIYAYLSLHHHHALNTQSPKSVVIAMTLSVVFRKYGYPISNMYLCLISYFETLFCCHKLKFFMIAPFRHYIYTPLKSTDAIV